MVGRDYVSCTVYPMKYDRGLVVLRCVVVIPSLHNGFTWYIYPYSPALLTGMGLLPDKKNRGLRLRREGRERFPRHRLRWRGKRSRHSLRNPQFYVPVKRPMGQSCDMTRILKDHFSGTITLHAEFKSISHDLEWHNYKCPMLTIKHFYSSVILRCETL